MIVDAGKISDIAPGGMKLVVADNRQVIVGNYNGAFFAVERACGHMKASLDKGTLTGYILTCPLHFAQFDIRTGEALSGPVTGEYRTEEEKKTQDLKSFPINTEKGIITIELP